MFGYGTKPVELQVRSKLGSRRRSGQEVQGYVCMLRSVARAEAGAEQVTSSRLALCRLFQDGRGMTAQVGYRPGRSIGFQSGSESYLSDCSDRKLLECGFYARTWGYLWPIGCSGRTV